MIAGGLCVEHVCEQTEHLQKMRTLRESEIEQPRDKSSVPSSRTSRRQKATRHVNSESLAKPPATLHATYPYNAISTPNNARATNRPTH